MGKKSVRGENSITITPKMSTSVHAEMDALNKLRDCKTSEKKKIKRTKYDMLVVRLTSSGKLASSRPCYHCIVSLIESGITIRHVYYSTQEGTIVREKFKTMLESPLTYISTGHKHRLGYE